MAERIIRVSLQGDATSLIGAANRSRDALNGLARVNLGTVRTGIQGAGNAAGRAAEQTLGWGSALRVGLATMGVQAGFQAVVQGFKAVIGAGLDYQGNMNTLAAVTGANNNQMALLAKQAEALGRSVEIPGANAADAAEAMKELAKGGLSVMETFTAAKGTLMLAAAAQISGAQAAQIQAKALNAFRMEASQAGHVADVLANAANAATGEITDMAMALQQSATVAQGFGIGIDDTTTTLALFAKNGVIGSDAGTSFKTMLTQLASPTKNQRAAMEDLNLTVYDIKGNFIGMESITKQLAAAHRTLTTEQYNTAASTLFGTDAIRAANILGEEGTVGWNAMAKSVLKEGGAAELAAAQTHGLNGALDKMKNVAADAALQLFKKLQPSMIKVTDAARWIVEEIGQLVNAFSNLPTPVKIVNFALLAMILLGTPMITMWKALKLRVGEFAWSLVALQMDLIAATGAAAKLGVVLKFAFMSSGIGIALMAITTAISLFAFNTDDAERATADLTDAIDKQTGKMKDAAEAAQAINDAFDSSGDDQAAAYQGIGGAVGDYTAALLGNAEAQDRVHTSIQERMKTAAQESGELDRYNNVHKDAKLTLDQFTTGVLANTVGFNHNISTMERVYQVSQSYAASERQLAGAQDAATGAATEQAAALAQVSGATVPLTAEQKALADATDAVNDALDGASNQALGFKADIDSMKHKTEEADLAAQGLTISLLQATGGTLSAEKAARLNAASMRMIATSARIHAAALDDVTKKQQELQELQANGTTSPREIARAQKAADKAAKAAIDAQTQQGRTKQQQDRASADAAKALIKAQEDAVKSQSDAAKGLTAAQTQAQKDAADKAAALVQARHQAILDEQDAQIALNKVANDPKSSAAEKARAAIDFADAAAARAASIAKAEADVQDSAAASADAQAKAQEAVANAASSGADAIEQAQQRVADAAQSASDGQESSAQQVVDSADSAAEAQQNLADEQDKATPTQMELADAGRAVADAQDAVAAATDGEANAVDAAAQSARDMAAAAYIAKAAQGDLAGGTAAATAEMAAQRDAFIKALEPMGITGQAAEDLADKYGLIPGDVTPALDNASINGAIIRAQMLNAELDKAAGVRTITFTALGGNVYQTRTQADSDTAAGRYGYTPGANTGAPTQADWEKYGPAGTARAEELARRYGYTPHAMGGLITKGSGPTADDVNIRVSKGEFVINAAQTAKHRSLIEQINAGTNGYARGGLVGTVGATTDFGVLLQGRVSLPDVDAISAAWTAIAAVVSTAWSESISPTLALIDAGNITVEISMIGLAATTVVSWVDMGDAIDQVTGQQILPTYGVLMEATDLVGQSQGLLLSQAVIPAWYGISAAIAASWALSILPTFTSIGGGILALATGYKGLSDLFGGMALSIALAKTMVITDITEITKAVADFFVMVDSKAPVVVTAGTVATTGGLSTGPQALADGGMITAGTGPRADDVHIRASKGEYIVNAKSTAKHKGELDRINYGGQYADGGLIGEKIGNRLENAIVGGAERAIEAGVTRVMASVAPTVTTAGAGLPVNVGNVEGARGRFLTAVASQMGLEYVWGGDSPPDFDCSGLMSWALTAAGVGRGRLTAANFSDGFPNFRTGEKPGDMAIFDTGRVSPHAGHIGAVLDPAAGTMMHTDGDGPSRVSPYRGRSGSMGFVDPIGGAYVPATPPPPPAGTPAGDPPASSWRQSILDQIARGGTKGTVDPATIASLAAVGGQTRLLNTVDPIADFGPMNMSRGNAIAVGPLPPGGAEERWAPMYAKVLEAKGIYTPAALANMMGQMHTESSGNPLSYNDTDSNFRAGHPSKSLLQTIPSTFRSNAEPGYSTNIWDPMSNAFAAVNYVAQKYNGVFPLHAYDNGGLLQPGLSTVYNGLSSPEMVMTDRQWAIASASMNHVISSGGGSSQPPVVTVNARVFVGDREITDITRIEVDSGFVRLGTEINRQKAQAL